MVRTSNPIPKVLGRYRNNNNKSDPQLRALWLYGLKQGVFPLYFGFSLLPLPDTREQKKKGERWGLRDFHILKEVVRSGATLRLCKCTRVSFSSHAWTYSTVHVVRALIAIDCDLDLCGYVGQQPTISMDILSVAIQ